MLGEPGDGPRGAEAAGFDGIAGMDHLVATGAEEHTTYEAMVTNTWLASVVPVTR